MSQPELFDVVELLVNLPDHNLQAGAQGAIVEQYSDQNYEVEFTNSAGETLALVTLPIHQFVVVWRAASKTWVSTFGGDRPIIAHQYPDTLKFSRG